MAKKNKDNFLRNNFSKILGTHFSKGEISKGEISKGEN
jgi:hypothetical protein